MPADRSDDVSREPTESPAPRPVRIDNRLRTRRLHRSALTWLIVVVVVVTIGGTLINWFTVDRDPQDPVEDWLDSMVDGRSRQALALFTGSPGDTGADAMPNAAYRQATGRISDWQIVGVERDGDTARVTARVWWPEEEVPEGATQGEEHTWDVHRVGRTGPVNDFWDMDEPDAAILTVQAPGLAQISINGHDMSLDPTDRVVAAGDGGAWRWEAMPGRFRVDLPQDSHYRLQQGPASALVRLGDTQDQEVRLEITPSAQLWQQVDERIAQTVESCMSSSSLSPAGCPVSGRWAEGGVPRVGADEEAEIVVPADGLGEPEAGAEVADVAWELESRPALWLVPDQDTQSALDWTSSDHRQARARLSYTEDGRRVEEIVGFPIRTAVTSDGRTAEIEVDLA